MARGQAGPRPGPKKPKTDPAAPGAKAAKKAADAAPKKGHNTNGNGDPELTEMQRRDLFLSHKNALITLKGKMETAVSNVRNAKKKIKADGFTVRQVEAAILMETEEGEEKLRAETAELAQAARWVGVAWGEQLSLALDTPDRTPAVDKAKDAGIQASMQDKPRKAPHAPESPQAASWYSGYDEHQAELTKGVGRGTGENVSDFPAPKGEAAE